jgi:hypothetical protein
MYCVILSLSLLMGGPGRLVVASPFQVTGECIRVPLPATSMVRWNDQQLAVMSAYWRCVPDGEEHGVIGYACEGDRRR